LWFEASPGKQFCETVSRKILHKNRAGGMALSEGPEFNSQYCKKKKKFRFPDLFSSWATFFFTMAKT
jgi:hypothetical protein